MAVDFRQAFPPASEEEIDRVEGQLGVELPDDYRNFLRSHNGGWLEDNFLPGQNASARYLFSAGDNGDEDIFDLEEAADFYSVASEADPVIPPDLLPVGQDSFDNVLCLMVHGDDRGAVYFWEHDVPVENGGLVRIAGSFEQLYKELRPASELDDDS